MAFGITNFRNYRIRALLYAGRPNWDLLATVTPRSLAIMAGIGGSLGRRCPSGLPLIADPARGSTASFSTARAVRFGVC